MRYEVNIANSTHNSNILYWLLIGLIVWTGRQVIPLPTLLIMSWIFLLCSRAGCLEETQTETGCCVQCHLWFFPKICCNNCTRVRRERSITWTEQESLFTGIQMEVLVRTSTWDSYWMATNSTRTSALWSPTSIYSSQFLLSFLASLTLSLTQTKMESFALK